MADYPFHYDLPKLRISDSEIVVQKACRNAVAKLLPGTRLVAIPNGQKRTRWQQQQAKAEGMSKGFPDLIAIGGNLRQFIAPKIAFVEIKALSALTAEQAEWLSWLTSCGHNCGVFRSDVTLVWALSNWGFK